LAYNGLCTFEYGIAVEVFGLPRPEFDRWYHVRVVGVDPPPISGGLGGVSIQADGDLSLLEQADLVIIPGWRGADQPVPAELCNALRQAHQRGARLASICSGFFVLAATGLLDGQRATTHWRNADWIPQAYPAIQFDPDVLYVDNGGTLTSAGSAAGLDLCLHLVRQDFGPAIANAVAQRLVVPVHRDGGQRQFIPRPMPKQRHGQIAPLLDTLRRQLDQDWSLARMAAQAGLSERTLVRRIKDATGETPLNWLIGERIAHAISLLEGTASPLDDIASAAGFKSLESMRLHFRSHKGRPPSWYRQPPKARFKG
jgi:AraC family transcriptional activator FtrA